MTGPIDVDALAHGADRELPALFQLFGGYFHQDWKLEYPTWEAAVAAFAEEAPPHLREDAVNEIARVLAAGLDDEKLTHLLYPVLDCHFVPTAVGIPTADWLRAIAARLKG